MLACPGFSLLSLRSPLLGLLLCTGCVNMLGDLVVFLLASCCLVGRCGLPALFCSSVGGETDEKSVLRPELLDELL